MPVTTVIWLSKTWIKKRGGQKRISLRFLVLFPSIIVLFGKHYIFSITENFFQLILGNVFTYVLYQQQRLSPALCNRHTRVWNQRLLLTCKWSTDFSTLIGGPELHAILPDGEMNSTANQHGTVNCWQLYAPGCCTMMSSRTSKVTKCQITCLLQKFPEGLINRHFIYWTYRSYTQKMESWIQSRRVIYWMSILWSLWGKISYEASTLTLPFLCLDPVFNKGS